MRSLFAIYVVAGTTLYFATFGSALFLSNAIWTQHEITTSHLQGEDLARRQAVLGHDVNLIVGGFFLALLQLVILDSARKLRKQAVLPDQSYDLSKKLKIFAGLLLGVTAVALFIVLAETIRVVPAKDPRAELINGGFVVIIMGTYLFTSEYLLSRRNPQALRKHWPTILALTLPFLVTGAMAVGNEGLKSEGLGMALLAVVFSCAGAAMAARVARHQSDSAALSMKG